MPPEALPRPEFSRPLRLALVGPEGRAVTLEATGAECAALAQRFGIPGIAAFACELRLTPEPGGTVLAIGRFRAAVTQTCVVTLEPVDQVVDAPVALRFLPEGEEPAEGPEEIDAIATENGAADLGEALAEQLALALDPYPRADDAALPDMEATAAASPFAALRGLSAGRGSRH